MAFAATSCRIRLKSKENVSNKLAIGMISAPRKIPLAGRTIASLRRAGFDEPISIYAEPGTEIDSDDQQIEVFHNARRLGNLHNWFAASQKVRNKSGDYLLICEDDFTVCRSAKRRLLKLLRDKGQDKDFGCAALYTPKRNIDETSVSKNGWHPLFPGPRGWGAQALCFSRKSLSDYMCSSEAVFINEQTGYIDISLLACFKRLGLAAYYHVPSLAQHDGRVASTIGHPNFDAFDAVGYRADY